MPAAPDPRSELRELFLFADLTDEQLAWVAEQRRRRRGARRASDVVAEGEPATCFYVLLSGHDRR